MKIKHSIGILLFILFFSCNESNKTGSKLFAPKIVEAKGYVVPTNSVSEPKVVLAGKPKIVIAGNPNVVPANTNIFIAGEPIIIFAGKSTICTPGKDSFLLPKIVPTIDSPFLAGIPEVVIAKDPSIKDQNPQNFSSFSKLQGLKNNVISCMLQDKNGNIWFGTNGGGVTKYDGKFFTHFTEKEGLKYNTVGSMFEDKSGNLWFGTNQGGVSKYDGRTFTHFTKKEGLSNNTVWAISEDKHGNIWFGTNGGGLSKYDGNRVEAIEAAMQRGESISEQTLQGLKKENGKFVKSFTQFSTKQGLSDSCVWSILEDKRGNLWFATNNGVNKYDGRSFTHFTKKEGLCHNTVMSMLEDESGNLWFGSYVGASKYDGNRVEEIEEALQKGKIIPEQKQQNLKKENGKLVKSFTNFSEGMLNNSVLSMVEDESGNIWFGTYGGLSKYDGSRVEKIEAALEKGEIISERMQKDLKKENGKFVKSFTHFGEKEGLSNNPIWSMLEDKNGNLWFGTLSGVSKYSGKSFTHITEKEGLINNTVWCLSEDKNRKLWFGTNGGVSIYDGKSYTHITEKEGLGNNNVRSILEDRKGNIWLGMYGGDGLCKYDGNRVEDIEAALQRGEIIPEQLQYDLKKENGKLVKSFTHFGKKEGLSDTRVLSMVEDKIGNLWLGTYSGGVSKYDGNRVEEIEAALQRGEIISETTQQGLKKEDGKFVKSFTHFTEKEGLSNKPIWSMLEDKSGNIWFCTYGEGLMKYDGNRVEAIEAAMQRGEIISEQTLQGLKKENGKFVKSITHFTVKEGLSNNYVRSILEDKSGNIWVGTNGGGVSKYDGKFFTNFTEKEGLSSNSVVSIFEDINGTLLFGTQFGLNEFKAENVKIKVQNSDFPLFKSYTYEDGFLGIGVNGGQTILKDKNGVIWIAANDRLTAYHVEGEIEDTVAPNIQVTSIELFNENIPWVSLDHKKDTSIVLGNGVIVGDFEFDGITKWYSLPENLSLASDNNYLTFNFIGITQKQSKKVKYQYKLDGIDENWSVITNRTDAHYGNLPQGTYSFKVKAMNSSGYWSNEFNYEFTIRPPWWKTWWFRSSVVILIVGSIIFYIKWRERALIERQKKLEHTVEERTAEVVHQKHVIEEKHKEITDSINYAERIQRSFLATEELLNDNLKDYFVFFQPKDVVSGDFYWASKLRNGNFVLATADSTGHGVPGAIMSILNISCLEKSVEEEKIVEPSEILNHTRMNIIKRLKKDGSAEGGKDGMDCSVISFDFKSNQLTYSAANNPIWIAREHQLLEFAPDKMPVGKNDRDQVSFTQHTISLQKGDVVYALTDGFPDQFGGPKGKKFMYKQLKELLISISFHPMEKQKQELSDALNNWKGNLEQVDDVALIGIRI